MSVYWSGCGGDERTTNGTTGTTTGGGEGGAGGGGTGTGGAPQSFGPPGTDFVSAAGIAKNSQYKLVFTVGQSTQNQGKMTNPSYRLQGGLIGANGSLP